MRYIIGIDLGTTNSCVAYVDTQHPRQSIQSFRLPQLTLPAQTEPLPTLPSFCYLCSPNEWPEGALNLPWRKEADYFTGQFARIQGAKVPTHLVQSAKSWLCHAGVNRKEKLLPFGAEGSFQKISPLEASRRYLSHIKEAWNASIGREPEGDFADQEIILTVPASFDEVARALTAEAAKLAGFVHMTLLEEPQAAFYSWISQHENGWENEFEPGQTVLVCDVGGGTTDFSLIEVVESGGKKGFRRMSVGDHLLLGGDNMDAAVAVYLEGMLKAAGYPDCSTAQWLQLRHAAREAKENLLDEASKSTYPIHIQGTGSSVIHGSMAVEAEKKSIQEILIEGFFGIYPWEQAISLCKSAGFRSMGLPYENDPSITRHLAGFLKQSFEGAVKCPDCVLFNGGAMKPKVFQEAVMQSLRGWFPGKNPFVLSTFSLDLAVARGAAYYGKARRGHGVKIGGGAARGYYLEIDVQGQHQALTLLPRGTEEGAVYEPDQIFQVKPNIPVSFYLHTSHVRLHDRQGELVAIDPQEMHRLPPIHTVLRYGKKTAQEAEQSTVPVRLHIHLTEIGTLELWLKSVNTDHRWTLEFQLRTAAGQEDSLALLGSVRRDETFDASHLQAAEKFIGQFFSDAAASKQEKLMEGLEKALGSARKDWPPSVLRGLWPAVLKALPASKPSWELDGRWWNLAGFILRPGFGYPLDDFRLKELWKVILGDLRSSKPLENHIQRWICYRRIAGGLNKGQQAQIANEIIPLILNKKTGRIDIKGKGELYQYAEKIRALGAFENLDPALKARLGSAILQRIVAGEAVAADYWALARMGARQLMHGSAAHVVLPELAASWIEALLKSHLVDDGQVFFVIEQLARKSDYREINLSQDAVQKVLEHYASDSRLERLNSLLLRENTLSMTEQEEVFGEKLPMGLSL